MAKTTVTQIHHTQNPEKPPSWAVLRSIFTCKHVPIPPPPPQIDQQKNHQLKKKKKKQIVDENNKKCKKIKCSGSLCSNTKVMQKPEPDQNQSKRASLSLHSNDGLSSSSSSSLFSAMSNSTSSSSMIGSGNNNNGGSSLRVTPFRRFSGCYECRMVVDPVLGMTRESSLRSTIFSCPHCGEIFTKSDHLELHQTVRHAVSELGPEDTSKNIVEIIFQSSWLKKQSPVCKIDRILKIHNTLKTKSNFESYRDTIKSKCTKKHARCVADGNELLRFHSTTFSCPLGLNGSTNLCNSIPSCNVCSIIKNGFKVVGKGVMTTGTSGHAHDSTRVSAVEGEKTRAMLVCRVIAGRVKKGAMEGNSMDEFDSIGGASGVYSNLDELYVFNPKAILPCFVVIYGGF